MLLFHGTRKVFSTFDIDFFGTGEGGVGVGFYFTDNLEGAYNHAIRYAPEPGDPLVYICRIRGPILMLHMGLAISQQSARAQEQWKKLPAAQYWAGSSEDWFGDLFKKLPFGNLDPDRSNGKKFIFLRDHGFQIMYDVDGAYTDPYLCGPSIVVLDERVIEIMDVVPAKPLGNEFRDGSRQYELAATRRMLGDTGLQSFLRRKTAVDENFVSASNLP